MGLRATIRGASGGRDAQRAKEERAAREEIRKKKKEQFSHFIVLVYPMKLFC
jgi:hypothetical protein